MDQYLRDIDQLLWIERRFGITKTVGDNPTNIVIKNVEDDLVRLLLKYQKEIGIPGPLPKIRTWITKDKLNFTFFNKRNGRRVLLGDWLSLKGSSDEFEE